MTNLYPVVLADPPWSYPGSQTGMAAAAKHYDTMPDDQLLDFPIHEYFDPQGVLFMWATGPRLDFAMECIRTWGLYHRGVAFVWVKTTKDGVPFKARGIRPSIVKPITEFVIAASGKKTGKPLPLASESIVQTVFAPLREHSRKPPEVQERIEQLYPTLPKLELFARESRPGWDSWGNETTKFD